MFATSNSIKKSFVHEVDAKRAGEIVVIDSFDTQDFNRAENGFIRSDISQLMRAQTREEYERLLSRMERLPVDKGIGDMSVDDAMRLIRPRYAQSANEVEAFAESLRQQGISKLHEAYSEMLKNRDSDTPSVETSTPPTAEVAK